MHRWQLFVAGSLCGVLLAVVGGYLYQREFMTFVAHSPYVAAASEAKLDVAVLRKLKAQDLGAAAALMEQRLSLREVTLSEYQNAFPPNRQDDVVLAGARAVEQYRKEWPK